MEIYRDRQWVVTSDGIEGISDELRYWIDISRIFEKTERCGVTYYQWPIQIAEKECVRVRPFLEAFVAALRFHARQAGLEIDEQMLARSLKYAITYNVFAI